MSRIVGNIIGLVFTWFVVKFILVLCVWPLLHIVLELASILTGFDPAWWGSFLLTVVFLFLAGYSRIT